MIILKPETFGGIAFNTKNAHQVHLDDSMFNELLSKLNNNAVSTPQRKVLAVLDADSGETFRLLAVSIISKNKHHPFSVLNSPTLADIAITEQCNLNCPHCYMDSSKDGNHMTMDDFHLVLNECKKSGVLQIALGGGEPTMHPSFPQILKEINQAGIVPNLTTNGRSLSWKNVYAMARYAGAVALSIEALDNDFEARRGFSYSIFKKSILKLKSAGINLVFQITISSGNLGSIPRLIKELSRYRPYGFLFLAYKPQGRGLQYDRPIADADYAKVKKITHNIVRQAGNDIKIGFDCCLTPSLMHIGNKAFEGCSAGRSSVAIMQDLRVLPCSFLGNQFECDSLKQKKLAQIWSGTCFNDFRDKIAEQTNNRLCSGCEKKNICLGGCPAFKLAECHFDQNAKGS